MHGWHLTGLDFEMAYLNAELDVPCYMRAPTCMKEYDADGNELYCLLEMQVMHVQVRPPSKRCPLG